MNIEDKTVRRPCKVKFLFQTLLFLQDSTDEHPEAKRLHGDDTEPKNVKPENTGPKQGMSPVSVA